MEEKVKTVATIIQGLGPEKLSTAIIAYIDGYRYLSPVHEGIIRTKVREMVRAIEEDPKSGEGNGLVLVRYFSTEDDGCGGFEYMDRFSLLKRTDILSQFQPIPAFDAVLGPDRQWSLRKFFESSDDLDLILLAKFQRWPMQLLWHWSRWKDILRAELLGNAKSEEEEAVVELTARYMEYLLGNLEESSEAKMFPHFVMPEHISEEDVCSERRIALIRDRVLNELSLYAQVRRAFRQLSKTNCT